MSDAGLPPLAGVRVIDFGQLIGVPLAGMVLAEYGAEVIKVERSEGDPGRGLKSAGAGAISGQFAAFNRSKRSIVLDLKSDLGQQAIRRLIAGADVVLQGFRPGVMEKLGLDAQSMLAENERLIYATLSAFGKGGNDDDRGGVDLIVQAESGIMSLTGAVEGPPSRVGFTLVDVTAGNILAQAVLAALIGRGQTGRGAEIEVALIDVALHLQTGTFTEYLLTGNPPKRAGNRVSHGSPSGVFPTADGHIVISAYQKAHWDGLCEIIGRQDLHADPRFADGYGRAVNIDALFEQLDSTLQQHNSEYWLSRFRKGGVPAGYIRDHVQIANDENLVRRGTVIQRQDLGGRALRLPPRISGATTTATPAPPPSLGEHTDEVLAEIGLTPLDSDGTGNVAGGAG